jgi:hypothetical protein
VAVLLMDSEKRVGHDPLSQKLVERQLEVCLLADRVRSGCSDHVFAAQWREVPRQALY